MLPYRARFLTDLVIILSEGPVLTFQLPLRNASCSHGTVGPVSLRRILVAARTITAIDPSLLLAFFAVNHAFIADLKAAGVDVSAVASCRFKTLVAREVRRRPA